MNDARQDSDLDVPVVVISGDDALVDALKHALAASGARTLRAGSDEAALGGVQLPNCALVIVDLPLAELRVRETVPRIRQAALSETLGIVVLVDGYEELEVAAQEYSGDSVYVIGKPIPLPTFLAKMKLLVGAARREQDLKRREEALARNEQEALSALKSLAVRTLALTDNATLGLVLMDAQQHCTFLNPAAEKIFGLTLAQVQGRPLHDFVHHMHPDGRPYPMEECPIDRALPTRMQERGEDVFVRPDGTFYPVAFTASPIVEDGVPVGTVLELRDVTAERKAQALQDRRARHAALMGDIGAALTRGIDRRRMLRACVDAIAVRLRVPAVYVWSLNEAERSLELEAKAGLAAALDGGLERLPMEGSAMGTVLCAREPLIFHGPADDAPLSAAERPRASWSALAAYPLAFEQHVSGVLAIYSEEPLEPDALSALAAVADTIALGVERLHVEQARRESEERFRNMADHAPVMLWVTDTEGRCTYLSKGWYDFTGQTEETGLGLGWLAAVHPDDAERSGQIFLDANARQASFRLEYRLRGADGQYRWAIDSAAPRFAPTGEYLGYVGSVIDISERVEAEGEVRRLNASLEERVKQRTAELEQKTALLEDANGELESFSYSVSHDLRAPLRHIAGFAQLLERRAGASLDDKAREYLHTIGDAAKKGGQLVDALLAFSRLGKADLRREAVDLGKLVQDVRYELEPDIAGRKVVWHVPPLPSVSGDPRLLRAVLKNLLSNALKYSRTREEARVEIGTSSREGEVELWVRDNGVGFDMAHASKLFGVFQRLHGADEFEGNGIGLANVQRIVQRHGGRVWAHAAVDEGATFHLALPEGPLAR